VMAILFFLFTLPRTLAELSWLSWFSAIAMFCATLTAIIFSSIQAHPNGWVSGPIIVSATATTSNFVDQFNAMLNITYTLIGQITIPSFIQEMKDPRDFPKALFLVSIIELVLFCIAGCVMYHYFGQYTKGSAIGSLLPPYNKISYGLAIPPIIMIGVIYSSVLSRFLFNRIFDKYSPHRVSHTFKGWAVWIGIVGGTWTAGFIVSQLIPFFNSLLSVMSSLFDSFFGFIFWGVAWFHMQNHAWNDMSVYRSSPKTAILAIINAILIALGFMILGVGTYASVESIIQSYEAGVVGSPFSCANNGWT